MGFQLDKIIELEESKEFETAFQEYEKLYALNNNDFEVWKHYYFFLWIVIENMPNEFIEKIRREEKMIELFKCGEKCFSNNAEFNFIVGYTMSIFPYEFGDFEVHEALSKTLLLNAKTLDSENPIFEMTYLSNLLDESNELKEAERKSSLIVQTKFSGKGLLNDYFRQVLNRFKA